jgi:HD-GYP domain-containing protein (c-di-GMP phosphodiesterase class II)
MRCSTRCRSASRTCTSTVSSRSRSGPDGCSGCGATRLARAAQLHDLGKLAVPDEIPLPARIIGVCDAYDAMTSNRPYWTPLTSEEAVAELVRGAGTQFDPTVVRVVAAHVRDRLEAENAA